MNTKRSLSALLLSGILALSTLGLAPAPARADGAGAAIIGAIVGYGLYKAGKNEGLESRYRYDRWPSPRYDYKPDFRSDSGRYRDNCDDGYLFDDGYRDNDWRQGYRRGYRDSQRDDRFRGRDRSSYGGYNRRW